jgi:hypothetical protein
MRSEGEKKDCQALNLFKIIDENFVSNLTRL